MAETQYFGTDGIRGRVGEAPITADFMLRLGRAAGRVLAENEKRAVVIGKDTRISGYMFESALEAGLAAAGANVALLGPMPTPAVAYLTRTLYACAGIVISASHNPFEDNGVKFFSADGEKLADELERKIEAELEQPFSTVAAASMGKANRIDDAAGRYIEFCKGTIPFGTLLYGMRLVVDCAHGSTYKVGPAVFRELGAKVFTIGDAPDGLNINDGFGSTSPAALQAAVKTHQADLGIAFDGDGDRLIMVDGSGEVVDGDQLLYIIARQRQDAGLLRGNVVGTVMTNLGVEEAFRAADIGFERTAVGDRFIHRRLMETGGILGGEASGHILCLDRSSTGDGIVSALQVLHAIIAREVSLAELTEEIHRYPQTMINVPVTHGAASRMDQNVPLQQAVSEVEEELGSDGRVILRPSGTEPLIRVTLEGRDASQVESLASQLADVVREQFA